MDILLTFTLSTGDDFEHRTSDFASIEECKQKLALIVRQDTSAFTFDRPRNAGIIIAARHVVSIEVAPAGDR